MLLTVLLSALAFVPALVMSSDDEVQVGEVDDGGPASPGPPVQEIAEPHESQSSAALRVNRTRRLPLERWFPGIANAPQLQAMKERVNMTYLQCLYHSGRWMRVKRSETSRSLMDADFVDDRGRSSSSPAIAKVPVMERWKSNPCGLQWINDESIFSGMDSLILVGDSTILRDYQHVLHADDFDYFGKVIKVEKGYLNSTKLKLSSGRTFPVHFFRLLYASMVDSVLENVFQVATAQSLIVMSLGPHDTSWLVFNRAMPGFSPKKLHNWAAGQAYWVRHAQHAVNQLGRKLREFEERNSAKVSSVDGGDPQKLFKRPVVVFRDMFVPNCQASKFVRRPEMKCEKLLVGAVVPFYRSFLRAHLAAINVPTVTLDQVMPPCYLMDAGHLVRKCKRIELQLFAQAFRLSRQYNVRQGFPIGQDIYPRRHYRTSYLLDRAGISWTSLGRIVSFVLPNGAAQDDPRIDEPAWRHLIFPPLTLPREERLHPEMQNILRLFYDVGRIEQEIFAPVGGTQTPRVSPPLYYSQRSSDEVPLTTSSAQSRTSADTTPEKSGPLQQQPIVAGDSSTAMSGADDVDAAPIATGKWSKSEDDKLPHRKPISASSVYFGQLPWLVLFAGFALFGFHHVQIPHRTR